jgi:hypothetical protein
MSSISSGGTASFSGLGVGCTLFARGALQKKEVMGLYIGLGFAGDLAGDFWVADPDVLGDAARRVCVQGGFGFDSPRAPFVTLNKVPLFGRVGGGV